MESTIRISRAERAGGALGQLWKKWLRLDDKICNWLATFGLPKGLTKFVLWAAKLIVLAALFYFFFWVALIIAIALAVAGLAQRADFSEDEDKPEWRDGVFGFGLYHRDGTRIDPHDPDNAI